MRARTVAEFADLVGGQVIRGPADRLVSGAMVDTRRLIPGQAYFAVAGARVDGHDYCEAAWAAGAPCAVVTRPIDAEIPQVLVSSTEAALASMARHLVCEWSPTIVAITGSVGKTSVKRMVGQIAAQRWPTSVAPGNLNSELGMPLAIANADSASRVLVLELAMRGRGQIRELARMAPPTVSLVTNVGVSHLEILGSRKAIAEAKREVYEETRPDGTACLPLDDDFAAVLQEGLICRRLGFGLSQGAEVRGSHLRQVPEGTTLRIHHAGCSASVTVPAPGQHQGRNAIAAAAVAIALGATLDDVTGGIAQFEVEAHRGQLLRARRGFEVIDDCYNAAPDSMDAALDVLAGRPCTGRRIAVLGDMLELGSITESAHLALGRRAAELGVDALVGVGPLAALIVRGARAAARPVPVTVHYDAPEAAVSWLRQFVERQDVVLVKASRALALEGLVDALVEGGGD